LAIIVVPDVFLAALPDLVIDPLEKEIIMGDKGGKKDKQKAQKQKQTNDVKKQEHQKEKMPVKKSA
jgi:hypothetical protein